MYSAAIPFDWNPVKNHAWKTSLALALLALSSHALSLVPASGLKQISNGPNHSCAVGMDGAVKCWGYAVGGQVGSAATDELQLLPVAVPGLPPGMQFVAAGESHSCAISGAHEAYCWGRNDFGQLGDGTQDSRSTPAIVPGLAGVAAIATGFRHTCAVLNTGGVKCWGFGGEGRLGDGGTVTRLSPVDVTGVSNAVSVGTGEYHSCALSSAGTVRCWGYNARGQLGNNGTGFSPTPVDVVDLSSVSALAVGNRHNCATLSSGALKCWGDNGAGNVGDGTTASVRRTPVDVVGLGSGVVAVSAGLNHTCALVSGGAMKCWGANHLGQLGDGGADDVRNAPIDVPGFGSGVSAVAAGGDVTCALLVDHSAQCWGSNQYGQLGDNSQSHTDEPTDVTGLSSGVVDVTLGYDHACALISSGAVLCWGDNTRGQAGNGTASARSPVPAPVSGLNSGVAAISAGWQRTCAVTTSGAAKCWGAGYATEEESSEDQLVPAIVTGLASGVSAIAAGSTSACAVTTPGAVKCWGYNAYGQLGDGTTTSSLVPVDVPLLASGVTAISVGHNYACAVTGPGGVKCWGSNDLGQLGDNSMTDRSAPVDVVGLSSGVVDVVASHTHTCALLSTGSVKCWGNNQNGKLGDGTTAPRLTPVDASGLSNALEIAAGLDQTCAVTADSKLKCWGIGFFDFPGSTTPLELPQFSGDAADVALGGSTQCVIRQNGGVQCWGDNRRGEIGNGTFDSSRPYPAPLLVAESAPAFASASAANGTYGVAYTHTFVASGDPAATFSVSSGALPPGLTLDANTGELTGVPTLAGVHAGVISATNGIGSAATQAFSISIAKVGQSITFGTLPNRNAGAPGFAVSASASSGLVVTLTSSTPSVCSVAGNMVTETAPGTCTIEAAQGGDANRDAATPVSRSFAVVLPPAVQATDFNADGKADLLWSNTTNGATWVWHMNGAAFVSDSFITQVDPSWKLQGVADFNGDGKNDLVWRNTVSGDTYVWYMDGHTLVSDALVFSLPPEWVIQGVADFNADGHPDFLLRNVNSGLAFAWFFNNATPIGDQFLFGIDPSWKVEAVADFSGDGQPDLLFRSMSSGLAFVWNTTYGGGSLALGGASDPLFSIDPTWEIAQAANWNDDASPDLLFRNAGSGVVFVWYMNGFVLAGSDYMTQIDTNWEIVPRR